MSNNLKTIGAHGPIVAVLGLLTWWFTVGQMPPPGDRPAAELLDSAHRQLDSARYDSALILAQHALAQLPAGSPGAAQALLVLGDAFLETGQWPAARQQFDAALAIFSKKFGARHLSTAEALNRLGEYHYKTRDYRRAEHLYRRALGVRVALAGPAHPLAADGYNNLGNCRIQAGDYAGATALHRRALAIRQMALPVDHPDIATSWNNLGNCAWYAHQYDSAAVYFGTALALRERAYGSGHLKTAGIYNNLGNVYAALGQAAAALPYYETALAIRRRALGPRHPAVAATLENIADVYFDQGDFIAALDLYRAAWPVQAAAHGDSSVPAATLQHKIALCRQAEGDYVQALAGHLAAAPVFRQAFGERHPVVAGLYNNLGNCRAAQRDYGAAATQYETALRLYRAMQPAPWTEIAAVLNNLGMARLHGGAPPAACALLRQAIEALDRTAQPAPDDRALYRKNLGLALEADGQWAAAETALRQAGTLAARSGALTAAAVDLAWAHALGRRGRASGDTALLAQALLRYENFFRAGDSLRAQWSAPAVRQRWIEQQQPALAAALETSFRLWEHTRRPDLPERAFALAERNKSLQLLDGLHRERAEHFAGIPDSLLAQERRLAAALGNWEKQYQAGLLAGDAARMQRAQTGLGADRQALTALVRRFEADYPDYYRIKYDRQTATPAQVRARLLAGADHGWVEYVAADSALFVFVVTAGDWQWLRVPLDFPLAGWTAALRQSIEAYPAATGAAADSLAATYADLAFRLYERLLAPVEAATDLPARLTIVPDGVLAYLPFECLLRARPADYRRFKSLPYVLGAYQLSFAHSASHQLALLQRARQRPPRALLAVAPTFDRHPARLRPLQYNRTEAGAVRALCGGDIQADSAATAATFLRTAGAYRVLLLATHGRAAASAGEYSFLAFAAPADTLQPAVLYARDLYDAKLPAELVVLSACETSLGEYRAGQGVISLAHAFFQAGAQGVVATLWSVDDARNADLVQGFFRHLYDGADTDAALRRAKLEYLQRRPHDEAHPAYWAALHAYGQVDGVRFDRRPWALPVLFVAGLALLAAAAWGLWRRRTGGRDYSNLRKLKKFSGK